MVQNLIINNKNNTMKTLYLFLCLIAINFNGFTQNKLKDDFKYKITYKLTYKLDSTSLDKPKSEEMVLFLGDNVSKFSSKAISLTHANELKGNSGSTSKAAKTDFQYEILKDHQTNELYYTLQIANDMFYYVQDKNIFKWNILEATKLISNYKVQKATTTYAGRDYIAWFTTEIPITDGPFKFNGLPGLILEISDTEEDYVFNFTGLENISPKLSYKINFKQYINTDKNKLAETYASYRCDPFTYTKNPKVTISDEVHKKYVKYFTEKFIKENNPIELK